MLVNTQNFSDRGFGLTVSDLAYFILAIWSVIIIIIIIIVGFVSTYKDDQQTLQCLSLHHVFYLNK